MDAVIAEPGSIARDHNGVGLGRGRLLRWKLVFPVQDTLLL